MKFSILFSLLGLSSLLSNAQHKTVTADKDWAKQESVITQASDAELIVRIGDIDNLGFDWPEGYDPFCGRLSDAHHYPWGGNESDLPGFDRILLSSKFKPEMDHSCGGDGYSAAYDPQTSKPPVFNLPASAAKGMVIKNAWLQLFIDDFQAPSFCSRFQFLINGKRFAEGEKILNAIDQTGPVGKLISLPLPEEFFEDIISGSNLKLSVDEVNGAADGFAIDFIRLLVNRKRENTCRGNVRGRVLDKQTEQPVQGAWVFSPDQTKVQTDAKGMFLLSNLPTGFEVLTASATGFSDGTGLADIGVGDESPEVIIYLDKGKASIQFNNQALSVGQSVSLQNILFDQGKSDLRFESKPELDKVVEMLKQQAGAEIELAGHTSSEGDAGFNRSLSYRRVKACKDYIVSRGIDPGRIIAVGFGPDRPVAPNDSEANRAKNRRVEMRMTKL